MSPTNKICKQRKGLSLTISKKSNSNDDKQQQNINELQEEIRKLKTMQNITVGTANINQTKINNPPQQNSKKGNAVSATNGDQQENIDMLKVISFVAKTMKNLSNYGEQLKIQLDFNLTQQGMQLIQVQKL